jgi:hypothetical protein
MMVQYAKRGGMVKTLQCQKCQECQNAKTQNAARPLKAALKINFDIFGIEKESAYSVAG